MLAKSGPLRYWWAVLLGGAVAAVALIRLIIGDSHSDLEIYRFGVDALWSGRDLYGALPLADANIPLPFIYPPFAAIVLTPLAALPLGWAVVLLFAVNLLSLGVTLFAVVRSLWPSWRGALVVTGLATPAALLLEPVRATFGYGQVNLPLMGLVAADCLLFRGRFRGIGVGVAAAVKLTPMAFVLFFLVRRDFRATLTAFGAFGVASGLGFLLAPEASAHYWFNGLGGASGMGGTSFHTNQTVQAVLARFGLDPGPATVVWLLCSALLLALVVLVMRRVEVAPALVLNATFALLISPTSWSHHWVWIAPGLVLVLAYGLRSWPWPGLAWFGAAGALVALFVFAPFRYYPAFDRPGLEWSTSHHWLGNSYVAVGLLTIFATSIAVWRNWRALPDS
ncbi:glycosyltransferase 87 family protein [Amycolatopsis sp. YIM 10]|uniref:glycosyltransferase 87 family protein n=1 Tax=Amycolatopsis sp. YIM 10 TaxID=2653857 RepID=UPI00128FD250|nr:glycosyltransferase 87 family protein [Amycolatopsis sp. YIM 10]QFU87305.1 Polyprenol-phosphate-mannose-dependent alpha-(1-2)-phosphatidylinositol mannoside mannosyltransferase [Amycolatopsis sp. YIM 10]